MTAKEIKTEIRKTLLLMDKADEKGNNTEYHRQLVNLGKLENKLFNSQTKN